MRKKVSCLALSAFLATTLFGAERYVGGDISLLSSYEDAHAKYYDHEGAPISSVPSYCRSEGMNAMRVRLFVNPSDYDGLDRDSNARQSLEYILPLCKRIKTDGYALMLDFHYSDTWADPAKQWTPKEWKTLDEAQLVQKIGEYTSQVLATMKQNGCAPDFIQTGNEISYGMLWGYWNDPSSSLKKAFINSDANWNRFRSLLGSAIEACRKECPDAKIVLHTERVAQPDVAKQIYERLSSVDYDIIGLSYYPYYHGPLSNLNETLSLLTKNFPEKGIMIVETGYPYKWAIKGDYDLSGSYPYSDEGQAKFTRELVDLLLKYDRVEGLFWWWMEYNAYGTTFEGWYNAPLWDSTSGRATSALKELCRFASSAGVGIVEGESLRPSLWYDLNGRRVAEPNSPGIYINSRGQKILK